MPKRAVFDIESKIFLVRGRRVMLDADLAEIYKVTTTRLNEQVRRNSLRFPADFMFRLTAKELENLRSQFATSSSGHGGRRHLPYAFTEHGAVMLASVLNSPVAIEASIQVVRAFLKFRSMLAAHKELAMKIAELEKKYDGQFEIVFRAIKRLIAPPEPPPKPASDRPMGF